MILMYHNLGDAAGFNTVSAVNFVRQLSWLRDQAYTITQMDDYVDRLRTGIALRKHVALTFDDAYESFQEIALPILRTFGYPATVYVPTNFVGQSNVWDDGTIPIMDWAALREIAQVAEVTIGSHGMAHRHMRSLSTALLTEKAILSKAILEERLGIQVHHFSYPYGQLPDFDHRCEQAVREAGYLSACSTLWSRHNKPANLFALHRIEIEPQDDLRRFSAKISRPFHPKYFKQQAKDMLYRLHLRR
jgi:peptidoglycan/xylan/chitin deacetylase (PgdA/CDA1 family)